MTVRHKPDSAMAGFLLLGWLSSRLGWEPGPMTEHEGGAQGKAKAHKHEIKLALEPDDTHDDARAGRDHGALGHRHEHLAGPRSRRADRPPRDVRRRASRPGPSPAPRAASPGILGEGIRQALLRDHTYGPALAAAQKMLG